MLHKVIISDASCIIALEIINHLDILNRIFGVVSITPEVVVEVGISLPVWFEVIEPKDKIFQDSLNNILDKGEASAIALAVENKNSLLLIDEIIGRKMAISLGLQITGTVGILLVAKENKIIPKIAPLIDDLINIGFYISKSLASDILKKAGEL